MYSFAKEEKELAVKLQEDLLKAIEDYRYTYMSVSTDYYDPNTDFVIIHGLSSQLGARGFAELLKENKKYKIKRPYFEISSPNYKIIQIHKNLDDYFASQKIVEENNNPQK